MVLEAIELSKREGVNEHRDAVSMGIDILGETPSSCCALWKQKLKLTNQLDTTEK